MWNFVAEKQLFSLFFAANLQRCQKSINDVTPTLDTPSLGLKQHLYINCGTYIPRCVCPRGKAARGEAALRAKARSFAAKLACRGPRGKAASCRGKANAAKPRIV